MTSSRIRIPIPATLLRNRSRQDAAEPLTGTPSWQPWWPKRWCAADHECRPVDFAVDFFQSTMFIPGMDITKMPAHAVMYVDTGVLGMNHITIITEKTIANFSSLPRRGPMFLRSSLESQILHYVHLRLEDGRRTARPQWCWQLPPGTPTMDHCTKDISHRRCLEQRHSHSIHATASRSADTTQSGNTGMPSIIALP